jgi:hypothetical protein
MKDAKNKAIIKMTKKDFIKEHKDLIKVLKTGKGLKRECKEQSRELKKYI